MKSSAVVFMLLLLLTLPVFAATCKITPAPDGGMQFENDVMTLRTAPNSGRNNGIVEWTFLPTGQELIDRNRENKNILGENWDTIDIGAVSGGSPLPHNAFYAPVAKGVALDGSAAGVIQECMGDHVLRRTMILRRDYAVVEIHWKLANLKGAPVGGAFRFFSAPFPGALVGTTFKNTVVFMPTTNGVMALDQNLHSAEYQRQYGGTTFVLPGWKNEPLRWWTKRDLGAPELSESWAAEVNRNNGNGLLFIGDASTLVGYYNCPQITLEAFTKAIALQQGEEWETTILAAAFAGATGHEVSAANPLFITCGNKGIIPLFRGRMETEGKSFDADPAVFIACDPAKLGKVVARDTTGRELGAFGNGVCAMSPHEVVFEAPRKPGFFGSLYRPDSKAALEFLNEGNFTVYCGWNNADTVKEAAQRIASRLGAGLAWSNPGGRLLVIGAADRDTVTRNIGLAENSVNDTWPGKGKGAIHKLPNLAFTGEAALLVVGSDTAGAMLALSAFEGRELAKAPVAPRGFKFQAVGIDEKIYPWQRPFDRATNMIQIEGAKGEYESAQILLTAYDRQQGIKISVSELKHVETGEVLSNKKDSTNYRRRNGPVQTRFVNYYPLQAENGFSGYPDPLLARPETAVPAGESRAVWLTFIIPEQAHAGVYTGTVTCAVGGVEQGVPIELKVWDFALPRDDVMGGEGYTAIHALNKYGDPTDGQIDAFIVNMVEHGMRLIHLEGDHLFQWRFDEQGGFRGLNATGMVVSADGRVLLDATGFEAMKRRCEQAAKPHKLLYMFYEGQATYRSAIKFQRLFPDRFAGRPERGGHKVINSYYTEEMFGMIRQFLERNGWSDHVYVKISDEPGDVKQWYDDLCQAVVGAGLPFYTAHGSADLVRATPEMSYIWQPIYASYNDEFMERARKAGKLVGWYNCGPPPTTAVGAPAVEWRSYLWQAAKAQLDIVAWWGIQCWTYYDGGLDLWRQRYSHWNSVVYPEHPDKPRFNLEGKGPQDQILLDSIRWETIRDGMEDAWMIELLRRKIEEARNAGLNAEADSAQKMLEGIWRELFPTRLHYRPGFGKLLEARRNIADAILRLQSVLVEKKNRTNSRGSLTCQLKLIVTFPAATLLWRMFRAIRSGCARICATLKQPGSIGIAECVARPAKP